MCYSKPRRCFTSISTVVCLGWALGVFFGLNYPEVRRNTVFVDTNCTVSAPLSVVPYRYCFKSCSYCMDASRQDHSCDYKEELDLSIDKYDLSPETESRIEGTCANGYKCCHQHCETCRSCSCSRRRLLGHADNAEKNHGILANGEMRGNEFTELEYDDDSSYGGVNDNGHDDHDYDNGDNGDNRNSQESHAEGSSDVSKDAIRLLLSRRLSWRAPSLMPIPYPASKRHIQRNLKKSRSCTCHNYRCHCYCADWVNQLECEYKCVPHFETHVPVSFMWRPNAEPIVDPLNRDGVPVPADQVLVSVTAVRDFDEKEIGARQYLSERFHLRNGSRKVYSCSYDPTWNPQVDTGPYNQITEIQQLVFTEWELGYTPGWWVLFGIPTFFVMLILMFCTAEACRYNCCQSRACTYCYGRDGLIGYCNVALWFGSLLPFALFLPIELFGKLVDVEEASVALNWTVYILFALGWSPLLHYITTIRFYIDDSSTVAAVPQALLWNQENFNFAVNANNSSFSACFKHFSNLFGKFWTRKYNGMSSAIIIIGWVIPVAVIAPLPYCSPWGLLHPVPISMIILVLAAGPEFFTGCSRLLRSRSVRAPEAHSHPLMIPVHQEQYDPSNSVDERLQAHRLRVARIFQEIQPDNLDDNASKDREAKQVSPMPMSSNSAHPVESLNTKGSVPIFSPEGKKDPSLGAGPLWDAEAEEIINRICHKIEDTQELIDCFERLQTLNKEGRMSRVQRGNLIAGVAHRRKADSRFRNVVWTIPDTSQAYGRLLMS